MANFHRQLFEVIKGKSNCSANNIQQVVDLFTEKKLNTGEDIFEVGNENKVIGFMCQGVLRAYVPDAEGNENNLFFIMENDFIAGNLTPGMKCLFTVQDLTNSSLLIASYQTYSAIVEQNSILATFHEYVLQGIHHKVKGRISKGFYGNSTKKYEAFLEDYPGLLNRIPHYYIASYLGITPTQLSRIRKKIFK